MWAQSEHLPDRFQNHNYHTSSRLLLSMVWRLRRECICPLSEFIMSHAEKPAWNIFTLKVTRCPMSAARMLLRSRISLFTLGFKYTLKRRRNKLGNPWLEPCTSSVFASTFSLCATGVRNMSTAETSECLYLLQKNIKCVVFVHQIRRSARH